MHILHKVLKKFANSLKIEITNFVKNLIFRHLNTKFKIFTPKNQNVDISAF